MSDNEHHRSRWPIRRIQDWILSGFTLTMLVGIAIFGVKAVRTHSKWMDRIEDIHTFRAEFDREWKPRIITNTAAIETINGKLDIIIKHQEELNHWLQRRSLRSNSEEAKPLG